MVVGWEAEVRQGAVGPHHGSGWACASVMESDCGSGVVGRARVVSPGGRHSGAEGFGHDGLATRARFRSGLPTGLAVFNTASLVGGLTGSAEGADGGPLRSRPFLQRRWLRRFTVFLLPFFGLPSAGGADGTTGLWSAGAADLA